MFIFSKSWYRCITMTIPRLQHTILPVLLVVVLVGITGCTAVGAVLGGGAGLLAKEEVDKSRERQRRAMERRIEREREQFQQIQRDRAREVDQKVQYQINRELLSGELTQVVAVQIDVRDGIVSLYGTVPSQAVADRAFNLARATTGVKQVISNLVIVEMEVSPTGRSYKHVPSIVSPRPAVAQRMPEDAMPQLQEILMRRNQERAREQRAGQQAQPRLARPSPQPPVNFRRPPPGSQPVPRPQPRRMPPPDPRVERMAPPPVAPLPVPETSNLPSRQAGFPPQTLDPVVVRMPLEKQFEGTIQRRLPELDEAEVEAILSK